MTVQNVTKRAYDEKERIRLASLNKLGSEFSSRGHIWTRGQQTNNRITMHVAHDSEKSLPLWTVFFHWPIFFRYRVTRNIDFFGQQMGDDGTWLGLIDCVDRNMYDSEGEGAFLFDGFIISPGDYFIWVTFLPNGLMASWGIMRSS